MSRISPLLSILGLLTALSCGALQFAHFPLLAVVARNTSLTNYFPEQMSGWQSEDRSLAETEAVAEEVERILQYDEYVYRSYKKDGREFSLYVCYWKPGKMPSREIAFHIPDKCWPTAGWERTSVTHDFKFSHPPVPLGPGQLRAFTQKGHTQHVLYWHIFSGRILVYNRDGSPGDLTIFTDLLKLGLKLRGEQYFIRISSPEPLETLAEDDGFQQILELVAPLGPGIDPTLLEFERNS